MRPLHLSRRCEETSLANGRRAHVHLEPLQQHHHPSFFFLSILAFRLLYYIPQPSKIPSLPKLCHQPKHRHSKNLEASAQSWPGRCKTAPPVGRRIYSTRRGIEDWPHAFVAACSPARCRDASPVSLRFRNGQRIACGVEDTRGRRVCAWVVVLAECCWRELAMTSWKWLLWSHQ